MKVLSQGLFGAFVAGTAGVLAVLVSRKKRANLQGQLGTATTKRFKLGDLPRDMREELFNLYATSTNPNATERVFAKKLVPVRTVDVSRIDVGYSKAQTAAYDPIALPPIVIADGKLIDGGHRVGAAQRLGIKTLYAIDMSGLLNPATTGSIADLGARARQQRAAGRRPPGTLGAGGSRNLAEEFRKLLLEPEPDALAVAEDLALEHGLKLSKLSQFSAFKYPIGRFVIRDDETQVDWTVSQRNGMEFAETLEVFWKGERMRWIPKVGVAGTEATATRHATATAWAVAKRLKKLPPSAGFDAVQEQINAVIADKKRFKPKELFGRRTSLRGAEAENAHEHRIEAHQKIWDLMHDPDPASLDVAEDLALENHIKLREFGKGGMQTSNSTMNGSFVLSPWGPADAPTTRVGWTVVPFSQGAGEIGFTTEMAVIVDDIKIIPEHEVRQFAPPDREESWRQKGTPYKKSDKRTREARRERAIQYAVHDAWRVAKYVKRAQARGVPLAKIATGIVNDLPTTYPYERLRPKELYGSRARRRRTR